MIRTALVAACMLLAVGCGLRHRGAAAVGGPDTSKIRVYVTTLPRTNAIPTEEQLTRDRSRNLIAGYLQDRNSLVLVDKPAQADVVVEVLSAASVFSPTKDSKFDENAIPVDVTAAGQTTRLVASRSGINRATHKAAADIDRWIKANRSKIVAARAPAK